MITTQYHSGCKNDIGFFAALSLFCKGQLCSLIERLFSICHLHALNIDNSICRPVYKARVFDNPVVIVETLILYTI